METCLEKIPRVIYIVYVSVMIELFCYFMVCDVIQDMLQSNTIVTDANWGKETCTMNLHFFFLFSWFCVYVVYFLLSLHPLIFFQSSQTIIQFTTHISVSDNHFNKTQFLYTTSYNVWQSQYFRFYSENELIIQSSRKFIATFFIFVFD